jgi:solute carrier family 25 carnitine/acylcarnitine transporter 20/29
VIKSAMMTDSIDPAQRRFPSIPSTARSLWAEGGLARFYRGFSPCILRAAPANAVMLFTVDRMLHLLG